MKNFAPPGKAPPRNVGSPPRPARASAFARPFVPNFPVAPPQGRLEAPYLQPPATRPSYDLAGIGPFLGSFYHIPIAEDYALLKRLRESIPVLDAAIVRLRQFVGVPEVECDNERVQDEIRRFLARIEVNRTQTGWQNWVSNWVDTGIHYGRSNAEMVLNNARNDVYAIVPLHPATVALRPRSDGYSVDVVQYQSMGGVPVLMNPDLQLMWVNDIRADDPNGTSLLYSLPFIGQIYNTMTRALGQTWGRFGSPTYHVNWNFPQDWNDPSGDQTRMYLNQMQGSFSSAMQARASGNLQDVFTAGEVKVEVVGAAGETLEFTTTAESLMQQITTKLGLPPFLLGFSWAKSERMSTVQAIMLSEVIEAYRDAILPKLQRLIEFRQAISGRSGRFKLTWPKTSLQDEMEAARADWMSAQGDQIKLENWEQLVRLGVHSMEDMAREWRPEFADFEDDELRVKLPGLVEKPPEPVVAAAGNGAKPPRGPAGPTGEGANALVADFWREETKALVGNGNGH